MFNRFWTRKSQAMDLANAVLGIGLLIAPWVLNFTSETAAAMNAWIVGGAIALFAVDTILNRHLWENAANLVLGIWAVVAPWLLGFAGVASAMYAHVAIGLIVSVLAAVNLWNIRNRPISMA